MIRIVSSRSGVPAAIAVSQELVRSVRALNRPAARIRRRSLPERGATVLHCEENARERSCGLRDNEKLFPAQDRHRECYWREVRAENVRAAG